MDREKLKQAAALILEAVGQDGRDGTRETPERFAKMMEERLAYAGVSNEEIAREFDKVFPCDDGNMVVVKDIDVFSFCEHHIALMYDMKIAIGYIPKGCVIGLSKLARIADAVCRRLQLQERIGADIAADNDRISHVVELLKHISDHEREGKAQNYRHRLSFCHI